MTAENPMGGKRKPKMFLIEFKNCSCTWIGQWEGRPLFCNRHATDKKYHFALPDVPSESELGWTNL